MILSSGIMFLVSVDDLRSSNVNKVSPVCVYLLFVAIFLIVMFWFVHGMNLISCETCLQLMGLKNVLRANV